VTIVCPRLDIDACRTGRLAPRAAPRIREVVFRNDTGAWNTNTNPTYPDGLYLGLSYRSACGDDWKSDIWFVDEQDRQPDLAHIRTLPSRLTDETRLAILRVKACGRRDRNTPVSSVASTSTRRYSTGVSHTPDDFAAWLAQRSDA
jgi:hypothetical protein